MINGLSKTDEVSLIDLSMILNEVLSELSIFLELLDILEKNFHELMDLVIAADFTIVQSEDLVLATNTFVHCGCAKELIFHGLVVNVLVRLRIFFLNELEIIFQVHSLISLIPVLYSQ